MDRRICAAFQNRKMYLPQSFARRLLRLLVFVSVAIVAGVLSSQGVVVGDDMGYCFDDSVLHGGDGERVVTLGQIAATQASHFIRWNGRVIVHAIVQLMLMPGMDMVYASLNGLVFALLWLGFCRIVASTYDFSWRIGVCSLGILLWLMPAPGVIWLSLRSFAVNYLWTAALVVWILRDIGSVMSGRPVRMGLCLCLSVLAGAMQESFSMPLLCAVGVMWLVTRDRRLLYIALALFAGLCLLLVAPGNYARAEMGGGFGLNALAGKATAMAEALAFTPVACLAAIYCGYIFIPRLRRAMRPDAFGALLLVLIAASLALGCLTFTALRQLVAPSLAACLLIGQGASRLMARQRPRRRTFAAAATLVLTAFLICGGYIARERTAARMDCVVSQAAGGNKVIFADCTDAPYNGFLGGMPFSRLDDDPFEDGLLHIVFDTNTRQGLRRLYFPDGNNCSDNIIVVPAALARLKDEAPAAVRRSGPGPVPTVRLDGRYEMLALRLTGATVPPLAPHGGRAIHRSAFRLDSLTVVIFPAGTRQVSFPAKKTCRITYPRTLKFGRFVVSSHR